MTLLEEKDYCHVVVECKNILSNIDSQCIAYLDNIHEHWTDNHPNEQCNYRLPEDPWAAKQHPQRHMIHTVAA
jgi:hypothetical protein